MSRLITHADVSAVPDGGTLHVEPDARLTPLAQERASARGIAIERSLQDPSQPMVQAVTRQVLARLGPDGVRARGADHIVAEVLAALQEPAEPANSGDAQLEYCAGLLEQNQRRQRPRAVITTTGRNRKGIVARLTTAIADMGGDVRDIAQTLVAEYFTMLLVVDTSELTTTFADFKAAIEDVARDLGAQVLIMHEDLVSSLQRT